MLIAASPAPVLAAPNRLVAETRHDFRRAVLRHLDDVTRRQGTHVVIDLRHTTEIDANGFGVLLLLQKRAREKMVGTRLLHAPMALRQIIELTKLEYLFDLER